MTEDEKSTKRKKIGKSSESIEEHEKKEEEEKEELTPVEKRKLRWKTRAEKRLQRAEKRKERRKAHPLNILRGVGIFFLTIFKIIYYPYVYSYYKLRDTYKFLFANSEEDLDRKLLSAKDGDTIPVGYIDEKGFLKSLPMFYFIAGTLGAVIAIFISFDFMDPVWQAIGDFFREFSWTDAWSLFVDILRVIFVDGIWYAMKWIGIGIWHILLYLFDSSRFWVPLTILIAIGVGITILAVIFSEADFSGKFLKKVKAFFVSIFTFPKILWGWTKKGYNKMQDGVAAFTFGNDKLKFYQKKFFYRVVIYSTVITLWIILAIFLLVILTEYNNNIAVNHKLVYPLGVVIIGFLNGIILLAFLSWFVGILSGQKYIFDKTEYTLAKEQQERTKAERIKQKEKAKEEKNERRKLISKKS
ncbi:MAG: hypothetical protein ACFFDW_05070 [Candidatus Thorarchaeota archaeon]